MNIYLFYFSCYMGYVSEIFGFPPSNESHKAQHYRENYLCPFQNNGVVCDPINKKSNLTDKNGNPILNHQTGACSVIHKFRGHNIMIPTIICPYRFLEKDSLGNTLIFKFIQERFFGDADLLFVPEVGLGPYGRADWMICQVDIKDKKHLTKNFNLKVPFQSDIDIQDYAHLELQADATTNTRELVICVRDFFNGIDITKKNYRYGLNSKASIKGSSLQMIDKGFLFQKLNKKSFWVMHESLFEILCQIYNVEMTDITYKHCPNDHTLIYIITSLKRNKERNRFHLEITKCLSTSASNIQQAISQKDAISEQYILNSLKAKINARNFYTV